MNIIKGNIIKEKNIKLKNGNWKEITYDTGEVILKRYDEEFKIWIIQRFTKSLV
jgi:hypothetical protein